MKKILTFSIILFVFFLLACDIFSPAHNYSFDISKLSSSGTQSRVYTVPSQDDKPFCNFSKYQIEVLYIQVSLKTPAGMTEHHTILNKTEDDPEIVNLATQKLSEVVDLSINDAKGVVVHGATIGIGRNFVINGTLYRDDKLYQTTSEGLVEVTGTADPADWNYAMAEDDYSKIDTTYMEGELPKAEAVYGINLNVWGSNNIELSEGGVLELKYPLDQGLTGNPPNCDICSLEVPSPYISGQTDYEIYYAKTSATDYYTEWWRFIFDQEGNLINEGGQGGTVSSEHGLGQGFGTFMTDDPARTASFSINADGTYKITADKDCCPAGFTFTNLRRLSVGGTGTVVLTIGSTNYTLEYKRVQ